MRKTTSQVLLAWVLAASLSAVSLHGCKKSASQKPLGCRLPKSTVDGLAGKRTVDLDEKERKRWLRLLESSCGPWPGYMRRAIRLRVDPYAELPERSRLFGAAPLWDRVDFREDMRKLCPGYQKVFDKLGDHAPAGRRRLMDGLYRKCGFHRLNLFDRDTFWRSQVIAFVAVTVHRALGRAGVKPALARKLSQLLLYEDRFAQLCLDRKIKLPTSVTYMEIPPNAVALTAGTKRPPPKAKPGSPRRPVVLLMDSQARYAELSQVLARLKREGVTQAQLAARGPAGDMVGVMIYLTALE